MTDTLAALVAGVSQKLELENMECSQDEKKMSGVNVAGSAGGHESFTACSRAITRAPAQPLATAVLDRYAPR